MTTTLTLFALLTLTLAIVIVLYVASLGHLARSDAPFPWIALIPFLTPIHTWHRGGRALAVAMTSAALVYLSLWIVVSVGVSDVTPRSAEREASPARPHG